MSNDGSQDLIVVCCVLLFSIFEAPVRAPRARQTTKLVGESAAHPDSYLGFCSCSCTNNAKDCKGVVTYHLALPPSMIVAIEQISFIGWNSCIRLTSYISLLIQAGKGRVFYSVDKCFETGADPRNIFDRQILKFGRHVCRHFTA